uniref:Peptidase M20 dimerisation domain-containing protein n=1 Tax=Panagrolaimus superbus TaxID=310955 RepID=A0A914Z9K9_9BILA
MEEFLEANKFILKPDYLIVGEPTEMKFASIQKGAVKLKLKSEGVAAHSGYPELGENAIEKLLNVLEDLRRHQWPSDPNHGETTMNIGLIEGGQALNALAESASASLFFRVTNSAKELVETVKKIVGNRVEIEMLGFNEPVILTSG